MAKILKNKATLVFWLNEDGDVECRMDAPVASDDLEMMRSHDIVMSEAGKQKIKDFATNTAIPQFKEAEEIQ